MNPGEAATIHPSFAKSVDRPAPIARPADMHLVVVSALLIGVVAIGARLAFGPQVDGLDDAGYLDAAQRVGDGRSLDHLFALFRTRVGMAYPFGWLIGAGWLQPHQFWMLTTFADAVTLMSLMAAGWLLAGTAMAGLFAAALFAIYPLAIQQSSMYNPTPFQVASISLALALIALAERRDGPSRILAAAGAGVSLGIGYLFKEDVAIVVPAMVLASLATRFPRPATTVAVAAGAALVFAIECAAYWTLTGNPLFRLAATSGLAAPLAGQLQITEIWRWDAYPRSLWLMPVAVGITWWLAIPALWTAWQSRRRALLFIALLFVIVMAYLQFGSGSLSSYSPLPKSPRYTALATPLVILLVGAWLAWLAQWRRRVAGVVAAAIIAAAVPGIVFLQLSSGERARNTMAAVEAIRQLPPGAVYTDYYSARVLRLLNPERDIRVWYHADFKANRMDVQSVPEPGAYALLDHQAAKVYTSSYEMTLPPEIAVPPERWQQAWTHHAYPEGSLTRSLLDGLRGAAARLPSGNPLSSRIDRNVADMIDGDRATLYRVQ